MAKGTKFTRENLTAEQNFKIVTALLIQKGIIKKEELTAVQDQVVELQNQELEKNPIMQMMMDMMPNE